MNQATQKILLVSKQGPFIKLWTKQLSFYNLEIFVCTDMDAAKAMLRHFNVRLLITDQIFTTECGLESYRLVRHTINHFPDVFIVAFTDDKKSKKDQLTQTSGAHFIVDCNDPENENFLNHLENIGLLSKKSGSKSFKQAIYYLQSIDEILNQKNLNAVLQPIVCLHSFPNRTFAVESLSRLKVPCLPWSPELLFSAAKKETHFQNDLNCIEVALKEAEKLPKHVKLFLNISPISLLNPDFVPDLVSLCKTFKFPATSVVLELTEQQAIINPKKLNDALSKLRKHKIQIAIDDFGVGFANLQLLLDIKPDFLKLSGEFCRDLSSDKTKQAIVKSVAELSKSLKVKTILEHIENKKEEDFAKKLGIDFAQGYFFSKPSNLGTLEKNSWFKKHPPSC